MNVRLDEFVQAVFNRWGLLRPDGLLHQFVGRRYGDRLYLHDLCHCIAASGFSRRDEELTAVLQSRLSREFAISYRTDDYPDTDQERERPGLAHFDENYFANVERFMLRYYRMGGQGQRFPAYNRKRASAKEIAAVYGLAELVDHFCHSDLGVWFYQVPAWRLQGLDASRFMGAVSKAWDVQQFKSERLFGRAVWDELSSLRGPES